MKHNRYYVYVYEKTDGTPYYVGKGTGTRAYSKHKNVTVPNEKHRIILYDNLTESQAFNLEKQLINSYGRLDNCTGTLHNKHPGNTGKHSNFGDRISTIYEEVRKDYLDGYAIKYLSRKYDIGIGTVYNIIEGLDTSNRIPKKIERNEYTAPVGRPTRLTDDIRQKVIVEFTNGIGVKKLHKKYQIGCGTIYKILEETGLRKKF